MNNTAGSQITSSSIEPKLWGDHTKDDIHHKIDVIYEKIAFWRWNLFKLPSGAAGKKFISETTKWIEFWNQDVNEYKDIALKVLTGDACSTSPEAFAQVDSETTLPMPLKTVNTMGTA